MGCHQSLPVAAADQNTGSSKTTSSPPKLRKYPLESKKSIYSFDVPPSTTVASQMENGDEDDDDGYSASVVSYSYSVGTGLESQRDRGVSFDDYAYMSKYAYDAAIEEAPVGEISCSSSSEEEERQDVETLDEEDTEDDRAPSRYFVKNRQEQNALVHLSSSSSARRGEPPGWYHPTFSSIWSDTEDNHNKRTDDDATTSSIASWIHQDENIASSVIEQLEVFGERTECIEAPAGELGMAVRQTHDGYLRIDALDESSCLDPQIQAGDILLEFSGQSVQGMSAVQFSKLLAKTAASSRRTLTVLMIAARNTSSRRVVTGQYSF